MRSISDAKKAGSKSGSKLGREALKPHLAATTQITVYSLLILPKALTEHTTISISCGGPK